MSKENVTNAEESLRSKRKFGKKGMAPVMKMNMLSKPEGAGTPSIFDPPVYASDDEDIEDTFKITKVEKASKTKKSGRGKGLSAIHGKSESGKRTPSNTTKRTVKKKNKKETKKTTKKRKSLSMNKGPDDKSSSEEDDEISVASGRPRSEGPWVAGKAVMDSYMAQAVPPAVAATKPSKVKATTKAKRPKVAIDQSYDSDTSIASGSRAATMRVASSMDRGEEEEEEEVPTTRKPFSVALSPVKDEEEEEESEVEQEGELQKVKETESETEPEMMVRVDTPEVEWDDSLDLDQDAKAGPSALQQRGDDSLDKSDYSPERKRATSGGRLQQKQSRATDMESEGSLLSQSPTADTSLSPPPSPKKSRVSSKKKTKKSESRAAVKMRADSLSDDDSSDEELKKKRARLDDISSESDDDAFTASISRQGGTKAKAKSKINSKKKATKSVPMKRGKSKLPASAPPARKGDGGSKQPLSLQRAAAATTAKGKSKGKMSINKHEPNSPHGSDDTW